MIRLLLAFLACLLWAPPTFAQSGSTITPIADVTVTDTATLVRARASLRFALSCTNNGTEDVRWGDSTVTATTGQLLAAANSIEIRTTAAVYMITAAGSSTVSCTEELR